MSEPKRYVWTPEEESALLLLYSSTRAKECFKSERGIKSKGWNWIQKEMADISKPPKPKDVLKSKLTRMLKDYAIYKQIQKLSGAGKGDNGIITLDDDAWERLKSERTAQATILNKIRTVGLPHLPLLEMCTNDAKATGDYGVDLPSFVEAKAHKWNLFPPHQESESEVECEDSTMEVASGEDSIMGVASGEDQDVLATEETDSRSQTPEKGELKEKHLRAPPSAEERLSKIKRLRAGKASKTAKTNQPFLDDETKTLLTLSRSALLT
jgi:hypothetical protein